jgi:hypothetical protein
MAYATDFDPSFTLNMVNCAAVAGTGSSFTSTVTTAGIIAGKFVTPLTAQTNAATPTTDGNTGVAFNTVLPNQTCALVFGQTLAGALVMVQGQVIATNLGVTTTPGSLLLEPQFPSLPANFLPLAYTIVKTSPSAVPWIPGTGAWAASGVVCTTFQNVGMLPPRPQAS